MSQEQSLAPSPVRLRDMLSGRAALIGARYGAPGRPGWISPLDARVLAGLVYGDPAVEEARALATRTRKGDLGLIMRRALAWALAPSRKKPSPRRIVLESIALDNVTAAEAVDHVLAPPSVDGPRFVHFVHAHTIGLARRDAALRDLLARATLVLPDGIGIRFAVSMSGYALRQNVNGTDLFPLLCAQAAVQRVPLVLVGARPGVAAACAERLTAQYTGLEIPITAHGYLDDDELSALRERVRALGPCVVLVGMGSPRQEQFAWGQLGDLRDATLITVGGLFDFYSGRIPRAPLWMREIGLEWLYRLVQEPRRLAPRLGHQFGLVTRMVGRRVLGRIPARTP